ncbi:putative nuclease HARBI1 [Heterodontus francisci]|uniref:putative nuclease HARBI1 n=1 Tax=Heterodontus francisci TaxID=7792 RepID=UPI00355B4380
MSREAVTPLCGLLNDGVQQMGFSGHPKAVALKVTVALNFYAYASFQGLTGQLRRVIQSAVHRCRREVTDALYQRAGDHVHFRTNPESQAQRPNGFDAIVGFPQVQGFIECTHVAIKAPAGRPAAYINRKGFHSLNVQLVCDHCKRFMQNCAHFSGSCHDAVILPQSQVLLLSTELAQIEGWLLGDKGYPLQTWLLTLVRNPTSDAERRYNVCHRATRATIKQAIGMLKMCFSSLDRSGGALQYEPERVARMVAVCCTLHNYTINRVESLQDEERREKDSSSYNEDTEGLQQERRMGDWKASRQRMQGEQRARDV